MPSKYPGIPEPKLDQKAMLETIKALKETVEILCNQRGDAMDAAVTNRQMMELKRFTSFDVPNNKRSR